ncbi:MAG: hypothetical protein QNK59_05835 [Flavobacteriales bacterium]
MHKTKLLLLLLLPLYLWSQPRTNPSNRLSDCDSLLTALDFKNGIDCVKYFYNNNPQGPAYEKLLDAYLLAGDSLNAWKLVRIQDKKHGASRPQYMIDHWYLSEAIKKRNGPSLQDIEDAIRENPYSIRSAGKQLEKYGSIEFAVALYEVAESLQPSLKTAFERAQLYAQLGQFDKQYDAYLQAITQNKGSYNSIKQRISQNLSEDANGTHNTAIKTALLGRIKTDSDPIFETLLLFVFRQEGNYEAAFDWLRAKSKKDDFRPQEFILLARTCERSEQLSLAEACYDFLILNNGKSNSSRWLNNVLLSQLKLLERMQLTEKAQALVNDFSTNECSPCFQWELYRAEYHFKGSDLSAAALSKLQDALLLLRSTYRSSLELGMTYLTSGNNLLLVGHYEEALLEYARAESKLGDSNEGDLARLGRAMSAFYSGDISWSKTQLEVLIQSTSKSIANDAMENALLISANSVEDTLMEGLYLLREPMLLEQRGRLLEAEKGYIKLKSVLIANEVYDDVLYKLGRVQMELAKYTDAANTFLELSSAAGEGMWKEESRYFRAKAMCLDQDIGAQAALEDYLISYPAGLYTEQARQFYRTLAL